MASLKEEILELLTRSPGLTDREATNVLRGASAPQQSVNIACRQMAEAGIVERRKRGDGLIGNYPAGKPLEPREKANRQSADGAANDLSEDEVKAKLELWLQAQGWRCHVAWGQERGIDIDASKGNERWVIEVKGCGSRPEMRVNYFIGMLGETLQRMDDAGAAYSIALPNLPQFRRLWARLPDLVKERTGISALFVNRDGTVEEETTAPRSHA